MAQSACPLHKHWAVGRIGVQVNDLAGRRGRKILIAHSTLLIYREFWTKCWLRVSRNCGGCHETPKYLVHVELDRHA